MKGINRFQPFQPPLQMWLSPQLQTVADKLRWLPHTLFLDPDHGRARWVLTLSGWFIPPQPSKRAGPLPRDLVTQSEDVLVDTRGYVYVTDKQWGLWILRYTGRSTRPDGKMMM
jgi:hypothetical protein